MIDANLTGTFFCLKAFVPAMIERRGCAMATLFLASDAAAGFLTGVTLDISGGRIML